VKETIVPHEVIEVFEEIFTGLSEGIAWRATRLDSSLL
jgi:hypothetical protein